MTRTRIAAYILVPIIILVAIITAVICDPKAVRSEASGYIDFISTETMLKIPVSFYHESTVPWTYYKVRAGEKVSSVILERRLNDIENLDKATDSDKRVLIFRVSSWLQTDERNRKAVLERFVTTVNNAQNISPYGENGLFRAYEEDLRTHWILIDKLPPVSAKNILATCTSGMTTEAGARCKLMKFFPMPDVIVSLNLRERLVPQRKAIEQDITKLVQRWKVTN